nr:TraK family protein [Pseudomonas sp. UBA6718]
MSEIDTHPNKAEKPAGQTLSQRIAARIQRKPDASTTARNRSAFLSLRNEIQQAYTDGWSLLAIWKTLHDEGRVSFTYQAFRRYAHQLIDLPMSAGGSQQRSRKAPAPRPQPKAAADAFVFKAKPAKEPLP